MLYQYFFVLNRYFLFIHCHKQGMRPVSYTHLDVYKRQVRNKMDNIRKGIKYLSYDETDYKNALTSRLRKDTEYVDYQY